jgi:hypothetical protein
VKRRDLRVAELRVVEPAVFAAVDDVKPLVDAATAAVGGHLRALPVDLRYPAMRMFMNEIGRALFDGANHALAPTEASGK